MNKNKKQKMNKKQRYIAACVNPYYNRFASKSEVKEAKLLARGKYWLEDSQFGCSGEEDYDTFCAYSPTGKRYYFCFDWYYPATKKQQDRWKKEVRQAARLWSKGKCKEALQLYDFLERKNS